MAPQSQVDHMIARAKSYFAAVDAFDLDRILSHMSADCILEVPTHEVRHVGLDAVRKSYARRAETVTQSWHGDFEFMANAETNQLAVRLRVKRTTVAGEDQEMDNLTVLEFSGDVIKRVSVWMAGDNSLT